MHLASLDAVGKLTVPMKPFRDHEVRIVITAICGAHYQRHVDYSATYNNLFSIQLLCPANKPLCASVVLIVQIQNCRCQHHPRLMLIHRDPPL